MRIVDVYKVVEVVFILTFGGPGLETELHRRGCRVGACHGHGRPDRDPVADHYVLCREADHHRVDGRSGEGLREQKRFRCGTDDWVRQFGSPLGLVRCVVRRAGADQGVGIANGADPIPIVAPASVAATSIIVWSGSGR